MNNCSGFAITKLPWSCSESVRSYVLKCILQKRYCFTVYYYLFHLFLQLQVTLQRKKKEPFSPASGCLSTVTPCLQDERHRAAPTKTAVALKMKKQAQSRGEKKTVYES